MTFSPFPGVANQALLAVISSGGVQGPRGAPGLNSQATVAGTSYAITASDHGRLIQFTASTDVTVQVPAGLPAEFDCVFLQRGTGKVIIQAGAGVAVRTFASSTRTAGQWAVAYLARIGAEEYLFSGEVEP